MLPIPVPAIVVQCDIVNNAILCSCLKKKTKDKSQKTVCQYTRVFKGAQSKLPDVTVMT